MGRAPVEREMWVSAMDWLQVGLLYAGNEFTTAYLEFSKDGKKIRTKVENMQSLYNLLNAVQA